MLSGYWATITPTLHTIPEISKQYIIVEEKQMKFKARDFIKTSFDAYSSSAVVTIDVSAKRDQ